MCAAGSEYKTNHGIDRKIAMFLDIVLGANVFAFDGKYYKPTDVIAMVGSRLAPVFAILFVEEVYKMVI